MSVLSNLHSLFLVVQILGHFLKGKIILSPRITGLALVKSLTRLILWHPGPNSACRVYSMGWFLFSVVKYLWIYRINKEVKLTNRKKKKFVIKYHFSSFIKFYSFLCQIRSLLSSIKFHSREKTRNHTSIRTSNLLV